MKRTIPKDALHYLPVEQCASRAELNRRIGSLKTWLITMSVSAVMGWAFYIYLVIRH
jgi:hypothetical protein